MAIVGSASDNGPSTSPAATGADPARILRSIGEAVYHWDMISDRLEWSGNVGVVLRIRTPADLASGRAYASRLAPDATLSRYAAVQNSATPDLGEGVAFHVIYRMVDDEGDAMWVEDVGKWLAGPDGRPAAVDGAVRVVTDRHEESRRIAEEARIDPLTGALTRQALFQHLSRLLAARAKQPGSFAVLLATIDNLALVNANYGYDIADSLIAGVARRMREHIRSNDVIARYTGNRLALVLDACDADRLERAAARHVEIIESAPIPTPIGELGASLRIGAVLQPSLSRGPEALLKQAEQALDHARDDAARRFVAYTPNLTRENARSRAAQVANDVLGALHQRRIVLAYQPIVTSDDGVPALYEALMRIRQDDGSLVFPHAILPVAEKVGLVRLVDQRVLELALAKLSTEPGLTLAINVSPSTALDLEWPTRVADAIARHPGAAERLIVELTEARAIEDIAATSRTIAELKALGVRVAMDDFGAGHTSFKNLRNLKVDLLKIDGGFIKNLASSEDDRFFARTLVMLARHVGIPVVAEWVEDLESVKILRGWGVEYLQGHYFGRAAPMDAPPRPAMLASVA